MNRLIVTHLRYRWLAQTETWIYSQIRHLPPDIQSHVVCSVTENLDQFDVPNIHSLNDLSPMRLIDKAMRRMHFRQWTDSVIAMIRDTGAQLCHSHFGNNAWENLRIVKGAGASHVCTFYGVDASRLPKVEPVWRTRYRELFSQVQRVLCEGPHMGRTIQALGCPADKLRVHHLGVEVDQIPFKPRKWKPGRPLKFLVAGSFREKKGIPYAIQAIGELAKSVDLQLTIIGDAGEEPRCQEEKHKILQAIAHSNLQSQTRLLGFQPHKVFFAEAEKHHIFLSPSVTASDGDTEGGAPVSIIEIMASGMPVVSTTHCDIPNVIIEGAGLLAPERNVEGLVEHLHWLVANPSKWLEITATARKHIEHEFNCATQGVRLADIYREVLTAKRFPLPKIAAVA